MRIVIVDDHQMVAESLARLMDAEDDIEVVDTGASVADAARICATEQPDVVVLDFRLPDGDGVEAAARIRTAAPAARIVMLTGLADRHTLVAAIDAGCSAFVTKDKALVELVHAVRIAHAGEVHIAPSMLALLLPRLGTASRVGSDLTAREREVLDLIADGLSNQVIAERLAVSVHTVRNHVQNLSSKLGAHSKLEAVVIATREGLLIGRG